MIVQGRSPRPRPAFDKIDENVRFNALDWMIFLKDGAKKKEFSDPRRPIHE